MIHPKKLRNLQKRSEVSMRSKVRGFYGTLAIALSTEIKTHNVEGGTAIKRKKDKN
jgi:hypothetical protein